MAYTHLIAVSLELSHHPEMLHGHGNSPIDAFLEGLDLQHQVHHCEERLLIQSIAASEIAIIELGSAELTGTIHGVGIHNNIVTASLLAIISAVNRATAVNANLQRALHEHFSINSASFRYA